MWSLVVVQKRVRTFEVAGTKGDRCTPSMKRWDVRQTSNSWTKKPKPISCDAQSPSLAKVIYCCWPLSPHPRHLPCQYWCPQTSPHPTMLDEESQHLTHAKQMYRYWALLLVSSETGSFSAAHTDLKVAVFPSPHPVCWNWRCVPSCLPKPSFLKLLAFLNFSHFLLFATQPQSSRVILVAPDSADR